MACGKNYGQRGYTNYFLGDFRDLDVVSKLTLNVFFFFVFLFYFFYFCM